MLFTTIFELLMWDLLLGWHGLILLAKLAEFLVSALVSACYQVQFSVHVLPVSQSVMLRSIRCSLLISTMLQCAWIGVWVINKFCPFSVNIFFGSNATLIVLLFSYLYLSTILLSISPPLFSPVFSMLYKFPFNWTEWLRLIFKDI